MAGVAARLAVPKLPAALSRLGQGTLVPGMEAVEGRVAAQHRALEGGDGRRHVVDAWLVAEGLHKGLLVGGHGAHYLHHRVVVVHAHLDRVDHRALGLLFERRGSPVPELELVEDGVQHGGTVARTLLAPDPLGDLLAVGEALRGVVAGGAGDRAVLGEALVEVEEAAQGHLLGGHGVLGGHQDLPEVGGQALGQRHRGARGPHARQGGETQGGSSGPGE